MALVAEKDFVGSKRPHPCSDYNQTLLLTRNPAVKLLHTARRGLVLSEWIKGVQLVLILRFAHPPPRSGSDHKKGDTLSYPPKRRGASRLLMIRT